MTHAERSAATSTRDDKHMIYEMFQISQYEDGSVLNCMTMTTFTAQQIVDAKDAAAVIDVKNPYLEPGLARHVFADLKRNAKSARKNGTTENLAPFVDW